MRSPRHFSLLDATLLTGVLLLCLLFVFEADTALAASSGPFTFENADIQTVVKQVATLTGITFLFDPEQVKGKITLLSPKNVSPTEMPRAPEVRSRLTRLVLLGRDEGTWIVPAERVAHEAFTVKVVPLKYAGAGEMAYTLSWVAPPSVRIAPHYPTNSLIISGHPAAVEELVDIIK